jgi:hypothetical protein
VFFPQAHRPPLTDNPFPRPKSSTKFASRRSLASNKYCVFLASVVAYSHTDCFPGRWPWHTTGHVQRPEFDPGSVHVRFVVAKSSTGPGFSPSTSVVSPDKTIPPMFHIQLHLQVALTRTNAGNLGNRGAVDSEQFTFLLSFTKTPRSYFPRGLPICWPSNRNFKKYSSF